MELFRLLGTIAIDNTDAKNALQETSTEANRTSSETESAFNKIGSVAQTIAVGIGTAALAIGGAFIGAVEGTREYRKEMGLLESAFLTAGLSSQNAKDTYTQLNAVLGDSGQAVEASQHIALLADNEKELTTWTDIATGVYATFGESLPIESLAESANEVSRTGILTGGLVDALNWAGISEEEFQAKLDKTTTEQERQNLIMNTLNGTYKEASVQYKETNKDVLEAEKAQQRLTDAFARVGEIGEPIMTSIKNAIASMAESAIPVLENVIQRFRDMVTWIKNNQNTIKTWVGVISGAIVTIGTFLLILNWSGIMASAAKAVGLVRTAILAMNTAMLANPIGVIVALLAGLVTAFIYLWNNVEGFRKFWINAWASIRKEASNAWSQITRTFSSIGSWFSSRFQQVQKAGRDAMTSVRKWFSDAWSGIKNTWSAAGSWFRGIMSGIRSAFSSVGSWFTSQFRSAWNGVKSVWNGAGSFFSGIMSRIRSAFSSVPSWFRSQFQSAWSNIKSVFSGWGSFFSGLWSQIRSRFSSIGTSIGTTMGNAVRSGMNGVISAVQNTINKGIGFINSAIRLANKLPGINVGTVGRLSLPRLAEGGVLERGQVGLLEGDGAEAVVPLERNTQWIDKVASQFNQRLGNDDSIQILIERANTIIELLEQRLNVYLDTGVLVGELSPGIDSRLGEKYRLRQRVSTH